MCGILGVFSRKRTQPVQTAVARVMPEALALLRHRGPNIQQLAWLNQQGDCARLPLSQLPEQTDNMLGVLGHARLSIIDLSASANQPMTIKENPKLWMVYNGEVYNFKQLRTELIQQGCVFETQSDSEVVLALYSTLGPEGIAKLNGMFSLAIWDAEQEKLFLARDRYGIKPLYYTLLASGELVFASEMKALLRFPGCNKNINPRALYQHLTFQNVLTDETLVEGVYMLPPAHWAMLDLNTGEFKTQQYWEPEFTDSVFSAQKIKTKIDDVRQLLEQSVNHQLVGDVPLGSFLSGGLDTGSISTLASQQSKGLHTFTCGFETDSTMMGDEQYFDERLSARQLATQLGTLHHEMTLSAGMLSDILPSVVWHLDDFRAGISYQNYFVSDLVSRDVTVVLSGVGGDELFAGYPWRYAPVMAIDNPKDFEAGYYQSWVRLLSYDRKNKLLMPNVCQQLNGYTSRDVFNTVLSGCKAGHPLHKALCFDMKTFLHGLLVVEDRLSMAHSLESRVPFLDNALVDYCLSLPAESKLQVVNGKPVAKWILKEAMKGLLPDEVIYRRKQGFTPPEASWMRTHNRAFIEGTLLSEKTLERGWFEPIVLKSILNEHFENRANHRFLIWSLLCFEWWQRLFLDTEIPTQPVRNKPDGVQSVRGA